MKKISKRLIAGGLACLLAIPADLAIASYQPKNEHLIENILSDYELFIEKSVVFNNHLMGAFFVGGGLDAQWSSMGDAATVDCYANHLTSMVNFGTGTHMLQNGELGLTNAKLIYEYANNGLDLTNKKFVQEDNYANTQAIFEQLVIESNNLASYSAIVTDQDTYNIYCMGDEDVYITINDINFDANYNFIVNDIDWFKNHICVISIVGINESYQFANLYNNQYQIIENGTTTSLSQMSGVKEAGQINYEGMNLVWNFPDATNQLDFYGGWFGHVVAPQAFVKYDGWGNFNGGVIAQGFGSTGCEGHFYPMSLTFEEKTPEETTIVPETTTVEETTTTVEETIILETTTVEETTAASETSSITEEVAERETTTTPETTTVEETTIILETATEEIATTETETTSETIAAIERETIIEETSAIPETEEITTVNEISTTTAKETTEIETIISETTVEETLESIVEETTIQIETTTIQEESESLSDSVVVRESSNEVIVEAESSTTAASNSDNRKPQGQVLGDYQGEGHLPITGKTVWPISIFGTLGSLLILLGFFINKK